MSLLVGNINHEAGLKTVIAVAAGEKNPLDPTSSGLSAAMMGGVNSSSLLIGLSSLLPKDFNPPIL